MSNFDFTFQDSYTGFWNIEGISDHIFLSCMEYHIFANPY